MCKTEKPILQVIRGETCQVQPLWLMRQAGRYLPEYRALRNRAEGFLDLCLRPEWAAEITLQPIRRFGFDAAILFADILLLPMAMGVSLAFKEGEGPVLSTIRSESAVASLFFDKDKLSPVLETVARVRAELPPKVSLIGFAGGPWTVACYVIQGNGKKGFSEALAAVNGLAPYLDFLIEDLTQATIDYCLSQIEAGAEIIQLFESHAGLLQGEDFDRFVIKPTKKIIMAIKERFPDVPVIGFPREALARDRKNYAQKTGCDVVSIDQRTAPEQALSELKDVVLQGNLDPLALVQGGDILRREVEKILPLWKKKHIFNLGHGVLPETPVEHVAELVAMVHGD